MKKTFNKDYFLFHRGCYDREKMIELVNSNPHKVIEDFLNWPIPIKDKFYFVRNYCELTIRDKQFLALGCAKVSLKIYEKKYPNDKIIRDCIEATENYLNGKISKEDLIEFKNAASAAASYAASDAAAYAASAAASYADAYASDAAAYAASAAASAAASYAASDAAAYADAYAASYASDAAAYADADENHTENLLNMLKDFCKQIDSF